MSGDVSFRILQVFILHFFLLLITSFQHQCDIYLKKLYQYALLAQRHKDSNVMRRLRTE